VTCWLCKRDVTDEHSVLWITHNGLLIEVCDECMTRADLDEPVEVGIDG
jgi:hypothetical protein